MSESSVECRVQTQNWHFDCQQKVEKFEMKILIKKIRNETKTFISSIECFMQETNFETIYDPFVVFIWNSIVYVEIHAHACVENDPWGLLHVKSTFFNGFKVKTARKIMQNSLSVYSLKFPLVMDSTAVTFEKIISHHIQSAYRSEEWLSW